MVSGNVYVPQQPENFQYDADGNLTNDGRWQYVWDAENRLITMIVNTNIGPQYTLTFAYDPEGRRISKVVSTNGVGIRTNIFLYDGWNLVATVSPSDALINSFMWGPDLSGQAGGAPNGAGGVGGLLEATYYGTSTTNCFPAYDGNGNIMALVNAANGQIVANYEYGPFGEVIRTTGPMAKLNPIRWSTKYQDDESDLIMYPYRPYKASTGTWLSRDPMQELGGLNLYEFADNDGINKADSDGRELIEGGEAIIADLAVQISVNYATGEHWYNISVTSVAVAAGLGLIGIPDIKDTGQFVRGVFKAGKISATASKKAYKLELLSNPKSIAKLNAELDKMTAEQAKTLAQTLKTGGLIGVGTAVPMAAEKIADAAETGIVTMPGCPNPVYGGIINVNIVQTVYYYVPPGN